MQLTNATQINLIEVLPAIYTVSTPTEREINYLVSWVRSDKRVTFYMASMVLESRVIEAAIRSGEIVEVDGYLLIAGQQAAEAPAQEATKCAKTDILETVIADCKASEDSSLQTHANILEQCLGQDPWSLLIAEDEKAMEQQQNVSPLPLSPWPIFPGLELKNGDVAKHYGYLFYVGDREHCIAAWQDCCGLGIVCSTKPNGKTGCWKLIVSLTENQNLLALVA